MLRRAPLPCKAERDSFPGGLEDSGRAEAATGLRCVSLTNPRPPNSLRRSTGRRGRLDQRAKRDVHPYSDSQTYALARHRFSFQPDVPAGPKACRRSLWRFTPWPARRRPDPHPLLGSSPWPPHRRLRKARGFLQGFADVPSLTAFFLPRLCGADLAPPAPPDCRLRGDVRSRRVAAERCQQHARTSAERSAPWRPTSRTHAHCGCPLRPGHGQTASGTCPRGTWRTAAPPFEPVVARQRQRVSHRALPPREPHCTESAVFEPLRPAVAFLRHCPAHTVPYHRSPRSPRRRRSRETNRRLP